MAGPCHFAGANIQMKLTFQALALHVQSYLGFVLGRVPTSGVALVQCTPPCLGPRLKGVRPPPPSLSSLLKLPLGWGEGTPPPNPFGATRRCPTTSRSYSWVG